MTRIANFTTEKKAGEQIILRTTQLTDTDYGKEIEIKVCIEKVKGNKVRLVLVAPTCIDIHNTQCSIEGSCDE